jgi:hypothetical protein
MNQEPLSAIPYHKIEVDPIADIYDPKLPLFATSHIAVGLNGDGTFQPPVLYDVPPDKSSVAGGHIIAGDINRDGAQNPPRDKNQG